jgi:hypothetical protein
MEDSTDIFTKVEYIKKHIPLLEKNDCEIILKIIYKYNIDPQKIQQKGHGVQIRYRDIIPSIPDIYKFINKRIEEKTEILKSYTETNDNDI